MKPVSLIGFVFLAMASLSLSSSARAETVYLDLGDVTHVGGKTIVCGGSAPISNDWFCSVIPSNYTTLYQGRGSTRQEANDQAISSCYSGLGGRYSNCDNVQCEEAGQIHYYCSVIPTGKTETYSGSGDTKREAYDTALSSCYQALGGRYSNCDHVTCSSSD